MMGITVAEAAQAARVTEKTIRLWIRTDGLPVVQSGGKGAGNGALVDAARFPRWLLRREGRRGATMADFFQEQRPGHNPLREIVDTFRRGGLYAIARALRDWADRPADQGELDWRKVGLTKAQARAVAWQTFSGVALILACYQTQAFEKDLQNEMGADLDDWASLLTEGDFRTAWPEAQVAIPPAIAALMPAALRAKAAAMADDQDAPGDSDA